MAIFLEMIHLDPVFPFRIIGNEGSILTTPHWHRELELIYVTKGKINFGLNNQAFELYEGEFVFIDSGSIHYVLASPGSHRLVFQFDYTFFSSLESEGIDSHYLFSEAFPLSRQWPERVSHKAKKFLDNIELEYQQKKDGYRYAIKSDILQFLLLLIRKVPKKSQSIQRMNQPRTYDILQKLDLIFKYVEKHYQEAIYLEDVASEIAYSVFHFTKFFKKNTGQTFLGFLHNYRIDKAKWLLLNTNDSVYNISDATGFESTKTFYRIFKQIMQMTPLEYRRKMQIFKN
jgi:AraC-like DNA-binding protein